MNIYALSEIQTPSPSNFKQLQICILDHMATKIGQI
jgi:hypothetical protein